MKEAMEKPDQVELTALVHEENGMYWAEVPSHPGLFASGETMDELIEALGEAWQFYSHDEPPLRQQPRAAAQSVSVRVPA